MAAIKNSLSAQGVPLEQFSIKPAKVEDSDKDPQQLYLHYQSIVEKDEYLTPQVIIEVSARSLSEPAEKRMIRSMIDEQFSNQQFSGEPFAVMATTPAKTFLEKIFLLHEEFQKDTEKIRTYRMTRHLHDLEKIMDTGHGVGALANEKLYNDIVEHRKVFNLLNFVDHASYGRDQLVFIPPKEVIAAWENDYKQMQASMFLGETISFAQLINRMEELVTRLSGK